MYDIVVGNENNRGIGGRPNNDMREEEEEIVLQSEINCVSCWQIQTCIDQTKMTFLHLIGPSIHRLCDRYINLKDEME